MPGQLMRNNMPSFRNDETLQQIQSDYIDILNLENTLIFNNEEHFIRALWQRLENLQNATEDLAEATKWFMNEIKARNDESNELSLN